MAKKQDTRRSGRADRGGDSRQPYDQPSKDPRYSQQDPGYYQQSQGYYQQGQGYYQQDPRYYQQGQGYYQQGSGYYQQGQGYYQQGPGYYQQDPDGQQPYAERETAAAGQRKKKKRRTRRIVLFVVEVLVLLILAAGLYVAAQVSKISQIQTVNVEEQSEIVQEIQAQLDDEVEEKLKGYWNIALYGVDSRFGSTEGQGDVIMIASINRDTNKVKLVSVYRDSYLQDTDGSYHKATDIYGMGGPSRSITMLNKNLDLDITNYATINMNVLAAVVDSIGGVEINVESMDEVTWINNYQNETSEITGLPIVPVETTGYQTLNGIQATSYCRIRFIDNDYVRTERQRKVLTQILNKFQSNPTLLLQVIDDLLANVETNLSKSQIVNLATNVASYELVETTGFPFEKQDMSIDNDIVAPVNLAQNVQELHKFLFDSEDYTPSSVVQAISNDISYITGLY